MKKLSSIFLLSLIFLLFSSCERPDLTDDVEWAYEYAARNNSGSDYAETEDSGSGSCKTIDGNMWSPKSSNRMTWYGALSYCNNLTECGYSDWHLPTISELRTLIKNCSGTVTGGSCDVTDSCLSYSCKNDACIGCSYDSSGKYSKLGDSSWLWSSSTDTDNAWVVYFDDGDVSLHDKLYINYFRCVR